MNKKVIDNQLFVFYHGELIFKKWLVTGVCVVFEKFGPATWHKE